MTYENKLNVTGSQVDVESCRDAVFAGEPESMHAIPALSPEVALDFHRVVPEPNFIPVKLDMTLIHCAITCGWPTLTAMIADPLNSPRLWPQQQLSLSTPYRARVLLRTRRHLQSHDQLDAMQANLASCGHPMLLSWRLANWGTTANTYDRVGGLIDPLIYFPGRVTLACTFKTSSPPIPVLRKLAEAWPTLMFRLAYLDPWHDAGVIRCGDNSFGGEKRDCIAVAKREFGWTDEDIYGPFLEQEDSEPLPMFRS